MAKKENLLSNFIPLNRELFEHYLWCEEREYSRFEAWLFLLKEARFEDTKVLDKGKLVIVKRGQIYASIRFLATAFGWSTKKVGNYIQMLETDKMIKRETVKETGQSVLTVCNYDKYNTIVSEKETVRKQQGNAEETKSNTVNTVTKEILSIESIQKEPHGSSPSHTDYEKFKDWLSRKAPYCSNPKNFPSQITEDEFLKLKCNYTGQQIANIIEQIENRKDLRKRYTNLYRTVLNWLKKEDEKSKQETIQQRTLPAYVD